MPIRLQTLPPALEMQGAFDTQRRESCDPDCFTVLEFELRLT